MSDYEYTDYDEPPPGGGAAEPRSRPGPTTFGLAGALVGLVLGFILAWVVGGNPFSTTNQVIYTDVVVGSVTEEADQICWAEDPGRRDSDQTCAILSLDPEIAVPQTGDAVTIGLVEIRTPDDFESRQVVHVAPATDDDVDETFGDGTDGTDGTDDTDGSDGTDGGEDAGDAPADDAAGEG